MFKSNPKDFMEAKVVEDIRNTLSEALEKCNLPYQFTKDRLLAEFTLEVCLAKV